VRVALRRTTRFTWKPSALLKNASSPPRRSHVDAKVGASGFARFRILFEQALAFTDDRMPNLRAFALRFAARRSRGGIETVDDSAQSAGMGFTMSAIAVKKSVRILVHTR
jgi:hypothetical protein